jgi:hypothetical protein
LGALSTEAAIVRVVNVGTYDIVASLVGREHLTGDRGTWFVAICPFIL